MSGECCQVTGPAAPALSLAPGPLEGMGSGNLPFVLPEGPEGPEASWLDLRVSRGTGLALETGAG